MYLIGILFLVGAAIALPILPDPPSLPNYEVKVEEYKLHTNLPKVEENSDVREKEEKDPKENKVHKVLPTLPSPPELPPLDPSVLENIRNQKIKQKALEEESKKVEEEPKIIEDKPNTPAEEPKKPEYELNIFVDEPKKNEDAVNEAEKEPKEEEPKKEEVADNKIEYLNEKPMSDEKKPTIVKWKIPRPPFLSNIFSSLPSFPISLQSISNLGWPFKLPSIFRQPRINYPGFTVIEEI